jgi:hypothetical protein
MKRWKVDATEGGLNEKSDEWMLQVCELAVGDGENEQPRDEGRSRPTIYKVPCLGRE